MAEWFAPKRYGLGSGLPIAWQGWAVLLGYLGIVAAAFLLLGERNPAAAAIFFISTGLLLFLAAKTTRGGWRWRWGERD